MKTPQTLEAFDIRISRLESAVKAIQADMIPKNKIKDAFEESLAELGTQKNSNCVPDEVQAEAGSSRPFQ